MLFDDTMTPPATEPAPAEPMPEDPTAEPVQPSEDGSAPAADEPAA